MDSGFIGTKRKAEQMDESQITPWSIARGRPQFAQRCLPTCLQIVQRCED